MRILFNVASVALTILIVGCSLNHTSQESAPNYSEIARRSEPEKLWPRETAQYVEALARTGQLNNARKWWFRGVARFVVWDSLEQAYAWETFNRSVTTHILRIDELDFRTYRALQMEALEWERSTPLELPDEFPDDRLDKLDSIRSEFAGFVERGLAEMQVRSNELDAIKSQLASGADVPEAQSIIPVSARDRLTYLGGVHVGCQALGLSFQPDSDGSSTNRNGSVVSLRSCNDLILLDTSTGKRLQTLSELEYGVQVLTVFEHEGQPATLLYLGRSTSGAKPGFYIMKPDAAIQPFELPRPDVLSDFDDAQLNRAVATADGDLVVIEICSKKACPLFVAYDVGSRSIVWQDFSQSKKRTRLISQIRILGGVPTLVSEVRPENGDRETELINLLTGNASISADSTRDLALAPSAGPRCQLLDDPAADKDYSSQEGIVWPDGSPPTLLVDPDRAPIGSCVVSPDGGSLLVIVTPFIYRFAIRD